VLSVLKLLRFPIQEALPRRNKFHHRDHGESRALTNVFASPGVAPRGALPLLRTAAALHLSPE